MAKTENAGALAGEPVEARSGDRYATDIVALGSAALAAVAIDVALQAHAGISPLLATAAGGVSYACMTVAHMWMRPQSGRVAPMAGAEPRRRSKIAPRATPAAVASTPPTVTQRREPSGTSTRDGAEGPRKAAAGGDLVKADGFEQLQSLVAELARVTPGAKAPTPDPDGVQTATAEAWAQYAAGRADQQASTNRQVGALDAAAVVMGRRDAAARPGQMIELSDALDNERMTIYLEPIQQIETDRPRHYEVSVRFKDLAGAELPHEALMAAARDAGMLPRIDAALLPRAARIAQHFQLRGRDTEIFSHVHGASLPDQDFRDEVTAATIAADGAALVLSFDQLDVRGFGPIHWQILSTIADMGLRFAIEGVTDLDMDFDALRRYGFGFVKLDADVLTSGLPTAGGMVASTDVCRHLAQAGLALIVGHIDDEQMLARVLGFGVLFGQGTLFGQKRAVRSDILTAAAAA